MFNTKRLLGILTLVVLVLSPLAGYAQPDDSSAAAPAGEEVMLFQEIPSVYSASKYEQKVTEAPSSVSIVTSSEIKKYGYRTLADLLRSIRSFYVTNDRNYSYVGVRGFGRPNDYNSRILLLIDNHRTNDNVYDQALAGTEFMLDLDLIDRVEVIRGPGSSLYGSNAFFAVVNVITKRGREVKGAEVSGEAGRYDTYKGRVTYGDRYRSGIEAIVSGTMYDSKGQSLYYGEYGSTTNHTDYDRFHSFFSTASFRDFTLQGAYSSRTKGIPTGAFGIDFADPGNKTEDDRGYLDLRYERTLGRQADLTARIFYDQYQYTGDYLYSGVLNKDKAYGSWWGGEIKLSSRPFDALRVIAGAEYTDNLRQDQENYDVGSSPPVLDDKRRSQIVAVYAQGEYAIRKDLMLNVGGRYDYYSTFGDTANPRAALVYNPFEKSAIKLLYGSAFRAPNVFELYYQSAVNVPNPDLKPERIQTYELVFEQYLGEHLRGTAAGYYYRIKDLISSTDDGLGNAIFQNIDTVEAQGFELQLDSKWQNGLEGSVSYTLQKAVNRETSQALSNSPQHLAKLNLILPLWKNRVFVGIEEQYTSERKTRSGEYTSDFFITNLTLYTQRIIKGLEFSASIYNLFDRKYGDPVSLDFTQQTIQQDGLTYRFKMTYAF